MGGMTQAASTADLICGGCGYNLRGIDSDRCPECGRRFDSAVRLDQRIAWEQRKHIGRIRAYWRTVKLVTFRPDKAAALLEHPMLLKDARWFRRVTLVLAGAMVVLGVVLLSRLTLENLRAMGLEQSTNVAQFNILTGWSLHDDESIWADVLALFVWLVHGKEAAGLTLAGLLLSLPIMAMTTSALFCPRNLTSPARQRCYALGHYACGPLAWALPAGLVTGLWWGCCWLETEIDGILFVGPLSIELGVKRFTTQVMPIVGLSVLVMLWWVSSLRLMKRAMKCSAGRLVRIALVMIGLHLLTPVVLVALIHLTVVFVILLMAYHP